MGSARRSYDVVIVGGAMMGASVAWHLRHEGFTGSVLVLERDPTYETSSTAHTNSCMRQQFSTPLNIKISQYAAHFVRNFREIEGDERIPEIHFQSFGYMYLAADDRRATALREAVAVQNANGAATRMMTPEEVAEAYPFYHLSDVVAASHNLVDEGYFDGTTLFEWWRRLAREKGVAFEQGEVVAYAGDGARVGHVELSNGETIAAGTVVNATGPRAAHLPGTLGIEIPVEPRKRYTFVFSAERHLDRDLPLTIDPSGVHVRSDGANYLAGCPPEVDPAVDPNDFSMDHTIWEERVWPVIAHRIPQFDALRLITSWAGHYAFNTLDQNAIVGPHPEIGNLIFINGFSGHGFQQSAAMGRGVAELITHGSYRALDLGTLGFERVAAREPIVEKAVI